MIYKIGFYTTNNNVITVLLTEKQYKEIEKIFRNDVKSSMAIQPKAMQLDDTCFINNIEAYKVVEIYDK